MVHTLGAQMQNVDFVETGFTCQITLGPSISCRLYSGNISTQMMVAL
jgi:hypothetical protein